MVENAVKQEWTLKISDRCDTRNCGAQAYVQTTGVSGSLLFCAHHYNKIMDSVIGYEKMMAFAFEITDERERLIENRTKED